MIKFFNVFQHHWRITTGVLVVHVLLIGLAGQGVGLPTTETNRPADVPAIQWIAVQPPIDASPRKPDRQKGVDRQHTPQQQPPTLTAPQTTEAAAYQALATEPPHQPQTTVVSEAPQPSRVEPPSSRLHQGDNPRPPYPALSQRLGEQGQVVVRIWVAIDGSVSQGSIKTSSGFGRLDSIALSTVLRWRFTPGTVDGVRQAMWVNVPIQFVLE